MNKIILFTAFIFCTFFAKAQQQDSVQIRKIANEILRNSNAYSNLRVLCKDVGPRLSGSEGAHKAVLATAQMLRNAGADTVYLQPAMVTHWERGKPERAYAQVGKSNRSLKVTAIGNTVATKAGGVTAQVVEVRNMEELVKLGKKNVAGRIVFFNIKMDPTFIRTFEAYGANGAGRRKGPAEAARYGAVGVIVRSLASNVDDHPHTGATVYNDSLPKLSAVAISTADAEWLSKELKHQPNMKVSYETHCKMYPDVLSYNVIGEKIGTVYPGEIITVGGHLDSWDLAEGAHDDGTGCVQSIEVIRAFTALGLQPKRTIRAVMFMNEENGGGGAKAYFDSAKTKHENHIFAMESDAGGFTPRSFSIGAKGETQFKKLQSWLPLFYDYGIYEMHKGGGGSDIGPLAVLGTTLVGVEPDSQRYFDLHHAETDVFEAVSKRELDLSTVNMTALLWLVCEYGLP